MDYSQRENRPFYSNNSRDSYGRDDSRRRRRDEDEADYRRVRPRPETRDPLKEDYLLELKEYANWLRERQRNRVFENDEIDTRYDQYKQSFLKNQNEKFFKTHSQAEWFRERYHPTESMKFRSQIYERKQQSAKTFMEYLYDKKFDTVLFDETSDHLKINSTNQKPEGHEDFMEYRYVGLEIPKSPCLFVNGINDTVKRADLDKFVQDLPVKYLEMCDPRMDKRNGRLCWLVFEKGVDLSDIMTKVPTQIGELSITVSPAREKSTYVRVQVPYANKPDRLKQDLEQARKLALHLDKEAQIEDGVAKIDDYFKTLTVSPQIVMDGEDEFDVAPTKKNLDLILLYLHLVHHFDYYTGCVSYSPEDHDRHGALPVRKAYVPDNTVNPSWATRLDQRINMIFVKEPAEEDVKTYGFRTTELQTEQQLSLYIRQEAESKFRCTECQKLFKGDSFVRKHIKTKHEPLIAHIAEEVDFFNNFCGDLGKVDVKPPAPTYDPRSDRAPPRRSSGIRDNRKTDPRSVRTYHDLDAPAGGEIVLSYD